MELDARELQDLAGFFGRRFPDHLAGQLAHASGVPLGPSAGWAALVTEAARLDRLPQLAEAAKRAKPGDPNVEELGRILVRPRRAPKVALGLVGLGLVAVVGVVALRGSSGTAETPPAADVALVSAVSPAPLAAAPAVGVAAQVEAVAAPAPTVEPAVPSRPEGSAAVVAPSAPTSAAAGACRGAAGEVIGYFHAGPVAPGQRGETVTLGRGARVRADYPDRHNHFNASAAVRCVLPPGARLRLDAEPIAVPGSAVWVPVVGGSVL